LLYPDLTDDARSVLQNLGFTEKSIAARDGRWFTVRIMPYRTLDDRIDGVVITFADITAAKAVEAQLRKEHAILERHVGEQSRKVKVQGQDVEETPSRIRK
jgi:two-component system CheB/CheR fusion protein